VRLDCTFADGPAFIGTAYGPCDPSGEARRNTALQVDQQRLGSRREMLAGIDNIRREVDRSGVMEGLDSFEK